MDIILEQISEFATSLSFDDLPKEVVEAAQKFLVDSVGCGLAAANAQPVQITKRAFGQENDPKRVGRVLGEDSFTTASAATFINTAMIRHLDFNDFYPGGHPSDMLGALLALSGSRPISGKRLITGQVVAYEVFVRLSDAGKLRERGWDQGYAIGVGTVAGLCNLLQLTREQTRNAIAIIATANVPLRATRAGSLSHWKGVATAYSTANAVDVTSLATLGMTGPERPFVGRHGLWEQITGEFPRFDDLGVNFHTPNTRLKYWPVEYNAQAAVWAAQRLRNVGPVEHLRHITVETYWSAWHEIGSEPAKWDPQTRETADHSLPYILARALVDGTINVASFEPDAFLDESLRPLMAIIKVSQSDDIEALWPEVVAMRVVASDARGNEHRFTIENPRGHEHNQMSWEEVRNKFLSLTESLLGSRRAELAFECWADTVENSAVKDGFDAVALSGALGVPS